MRSIRKIINVGENISAREAAWSFDGDVPKSFSEHVKKSVPFYDEGHDLVCKLSDFFVHDSSVCYELGSSTGILTNKLAKKHDHRPKARWIGIDVSKGMIKQAREKSQDMKNIKFVARDILAFPYQKSDFIVSYYTMQFVSPRIRQDIFNKIYKSLNWGGAFVIFEKVRACDARFQDMMQTLYTDYKLDQGYSPAKIIAKTKSLKGVLEPFSTRGNIDLLKRAGFVDFITVFKYICFEGFLAIK